MLNKLENLCAFFIFMWYFVGRWITFAYLQYDNNIYNFSSNAIYNIIACVTIIYLSIVFITKNWYNNFSKNKLLISLINKQKIVKTYKIYYTILTIVLFVCHAYYFSLMFIDLMHHNKLMGKLDILLDPLFLLYFSIQLNKIFKKLN